MSDVHVARGGHAVLQGVDLTVSPGSRWGIVGENGRGKSTLLHVLSGDLVPDRGDVSRLGSLGVAGQELAGSGRTVEGLISIHLAAARAAVRAVDDTIAGAGAAFQAALDTAVALDAWDADRRVDIALEALGAVTDRERLLETMSVGQRYRVRLACLLGANDDFLLLDEPTNHLDQQGLDFLTARLRAWPGGIVLVSHDRDLLSDVATSVLDLGPSRDGRPVSYGDGYAGYVRGRSAYLQSWADDYAAQQAIQARLADDLAAAQDRLSTGWRPDKGTGKHQRATRAPGLVRSVHRRAASLAAGAVSMPSPPPRFVMPALTAPAGVALVEALGVRVRGRLETPVDVTLPAGSRLVVTGPNGAGKSTLLAVLARLLLPTEGSVRCHPAARIALLAQESPALGGPLSGDPLSGGPLSTGQQRRIDLAAVLAGEPNVLLLDEPTNHLSTALVEELTAALATTGAAVVLATHDRWLRRETADWPQLLL
ncbi:ATP-binding cassette domain-containing protein [Winogradskya humida]|nr:ATP-binding cassette domain-containing protein [Actinoplanes humidus]